MSGVYEGDRNIAQVLSEGDFGLGTLDRVNGELVIDQGKCYACNSEGKARLLTGTEITPFSVITPFVADHRQSLSYCDSIIDMNLQLDQLIINPNHMCAIRLQGEFLEIKARSECPQPKPYRPLNETLPKLQNHFTWNAIEGTMVVTYFPDYLSSVNASGYHYHFISSDHQYGGHVFDFSFNTPVEAEWMIVDRLIMDSIDNRCFEKTAITTVDVNSSDSVEKFK